MPNVKSFLSDAPTVLPTRTALDAAVMHTTAPLGIVSFEGYHCAMDCTECEDLNRRHALATEKYMEADRRRKAYVPGAYFWP
jgi:hypothetical protein